MIMEHVLEDKELGRLLVRVKCPCPASDFSYA